MNSEYDAVHNFNEQAIFRAVSTTAEQFPELLGQPEVLADVACIALNRMPPRYIRHDVDNTFYMSDDDRSKHEIAVDAAVAFAFGFVRSRTARRSA